LVCDGGTERCDVVRTGTHRSPGVASGLQLPESRRDHEREGRES
jgi:hypothetical protein